MHLIRIHPIKNLPMCVKVDILGPFGPDTDLRRYGLQLCERGGKNAKKRAAVAVARKLAVLLHRLWVSGEVYEPLGYASSGRSHHRLRRPKERRQMGAGSRSPELKTRASIDRQKVGRQ
jgi:hypothetical protein